MQQPFLEIKKRAVYVTPRMKVSGGFPEHLHNHAEMVWMISGHRSMIIQGQTYRLDAGDLALVFPNMIHGYLASEDAEAMMMIFSPEISADFGHILQTCLPLEPIVRAEKIHSEIPWLMQAVCRESRGGNSESVIKAYIQVILARLFPSIPLLTEASSRTLDSAIHRLLRYMAEHFKEPVTLDSTAHELGISKSYLSHIFSDRLNVNFRAYVNALRVDHAQRLLRSTDMTVTQVSFACGYENQRTFNRAFMLNCGATPSQYRAAIKSDGGNHVSTFSQTLL